MEQVKIGCHLIKEVKITWNPFCDIPTKDTQIESNFEQYQINPN